jgi:hypothetical protein
VAKLERNRGGCDYKAVAKKNQYKYYFSMVKTIKIGKIHYLPSIVIKSVFLYFHEATNHGLIRDFHHFFFLHIANKTITHKLITDAVAQICFHNLHARENPLNCSSSNWQY